MLELKPSEKGSPLWQKVEAHLEERLISEQKSLESVNITEKAADVCRGRILEIRAMQRVGEEPEGLPEEDEL